MMLKLVALIVVSIAGWWAVPAVAADHPVWPPPGLAAPAEVAWQSVVDELRPRGIGRFFRIVAGAERRQQSWRMPQPVAVALSEGRVFVVDTALDVVVGAELDGGAAVRLRLPEGVHPVAVAAHPRKDVILVVDRGSGAVFSFGPKGSPNGEVVGGGLVQRAGGLGVCANGDVLITDAKAGQVVRVRSNGTEVARTGSVGTGEGEFNTPTAVVEAPNGAIWVLDTFNFRVQQLDSDLQFISMFGEPGDGSGHFALAKGLAVDPDGHLFISDGRFDVVQVFDEDGRLLLIVGGHGTGDGQFWNPAGLAIDRLGRIAVADTANERIQLFRYQRRDDAQ